MDGEKEKLRGGAGRKLLTGIELDMKNSGIVTCEAALSRFRQSSEKDLPKQEQFYAMS